MTVLIFGIVELDKLPACACVFSELIVPVVVVVVVVVVSGDGGMLDWGLDKGALCVSTTVV